MHDDALMKQWWTNCIKCDLSVIFRETYDGPGIPDPDEHWEGGEYLTCPRCGITIDGWNGDPEVTR